jgi:hypothetical protein
VIGSAALSVVVLSEEDAVAQEVDACSSVHLSLEQCSHTRFLFTAGTEVAPIRSTMQARYLGTR